jgi:hypothetical protein
MKPRHTLTDDIDPSIQMAREAAPVTVGDIKFEPITARRLYAAQGMGLRAFSLSPEDRDKGASYPGFIADVVTVLWLCAHPASTAIDALASPREALEKAMAWGEEKDIQPFSKTFPDFMAAYGGLLNPIMEQDSAPVSGEDGEGSKKKRRSGG